MVGLLVYYVGVMNVSDELDNCLSTTAATSTTSKPVKEKVLNSTYALNQEFIQIIKGVIIKSIWNIIISNFISGQRCAFANSFEPH